MTFWKAFGIALMGSWCAGQRDWIADQVTKYPEAPNLGFTLASVVGFVVAVVGCYGIWLLMVKDTPNDGR